MSTNDTISIYSYIYAMKTSKFFLLFSATLMAWLLLGGCQQTEATPTANPLATEAVETDLWQQAWNSVISTQTRIASMPTQTPTPTITPFPTATLPVVKPMTAAPLSDVRLSGRILYSFNDPSINLSEYHFDKPFQIKADGLSSDLFVETWSEDEKYLAIILDLPPTNQAIANYADLGVCIFDAQQIDNKNLRDSAKCIAVYKNVPIEKYSQIYTEIQNVSWSPDDQYLVVTVKGGEAPLYPITSPCLVEVQTGKVDCGWANIFRSGYYDNDQRLIAGAYAISWSPQDKNKLVFPIKNNWRLLEMGVGPAYTSFPPFSYDVPTGYASDGLYLMNITPRFKAYQYSTLKFQSLKLTQIWQAPANTTMDFKQLPLWSSDGTRVTFVYIDPWLNIAEARLPAANYVVASIDDDGQNFTRLFDSQDLQMTGVIPPGFDIPTIHIHEWLANDRILLFTVQTHSDAEKKYIQSLFLYDMVTEHFFQLTDWNEFYLL